MTGGAIHALEFSPDASMLAVLGGTQALILDTQSGDVVVEFQPGEIHGSLAFADKDHVYIGSESGALRVIARDTAGTWSMQQLWQGSAAIKLLRASPRGQFLVLVDQNDLAQQFSLAEGRVGTLSINLPDAVEDVAFNPAGSRVFLRTARWIQRASSSTNGLIWLDAIFGPRAMHGAGIVVGAGPGTDVYVPIARAGSVGLRRLQFPASEGPGLFGSKDELLHEWRTRLGLAPEGCYNAGANGRTGRCGTTRLAKIPTQGPNQNLELRRADFSGRNRLANDDPHPGKQPAGNLSDTAALAATEPAAPQMPQRNRYDRHRLCLQ